MVTIWKSAYEGASIVVAPTRFIICRSAPGAVPGRNLTAMLPRKYASPPERVTASAGYGRGGRGASLSRIPVSTPGRVVSEMNVRYRVVESCAVTTPTASVTTVRTPTDLDRNIQPSRSTGDRQETNVTAGAKADRFRRVLDRAALRWPSPVPRRPPTS